MHQNLLLLLHLPDCVLKFGRLNSVGCLPFEENNRKLVPMVKRREDEFSKVYPIFQELSTRALQVSNDSIKDSLGSLNILRSCNLKKNSNSKRCFDLNEVNLNDLQDKIIEVFYQNFNTEIKCIKVARRIIQ